MWWVVAGTSVADGATAFSCWGDDLQCSWERRCVWRLADKVGSGEVLVLGATCHNKTCSGWSWAAVRCGAVFGLGWVGGGVEWGDDAFRCWGENMQCSWERRAT